MSTHEAEELLADDAYFRALSTSRLVEAGELAQLARSLASEATASPYTGEQIGQRLLARGRLTSWQHQELLAGRTQFFLGNYELLSFVGRGAYGEVFRARHRHMGREVAVKVLPAALTDSELHRRRFYREGQAAAFLHHPNIVQVFDVDERDGTHYMVLEYVRGPSLRDLVRQRGPLPVRMAAELIRQAALGLAHAHSRGLIHRDVKPSNLLLDEGGLVKLSDLGIARVPNEHDAAHELGGPNMMMGTLDYQPPEQWEDAHQVDARADLYSLGCTLCYLLTGEPPFPRGTQAQRVQQHQLAEPPDLSSIRDDVPEELERIFLRLVAKSPEDRFDQARTVAEALASWLDRPTPEPPPVPASPVPASPVPASPVPASPAPVEEATLRDQIQDEQLRTLVNERLITPLQYDILRGRRWEPLRVGSYHLLERIEDGRLAGLYRGRHALWQMPVCLRLIRLSEDAEQAEGERERFGASMRVVSQCEHPQIARTFDFGEDRGVLYVVLEPLVGKSLDEWFDTANLPPRAEVVRIVREVATAVAHLHQLGIVHRGVLPRNIWIDETNRVKLLGCDWACENALNGAPGPDDGGSSRPGHSGWPDADYKPPEARTADAAPTPAADVYGLGVTLYRGLSGRLPATDAEGCWRPPSVFAREVGGSLDELCLAMLATEPEQRPTALEVGHELWQSLARPATESCGP